MTKVFESKYEGVSFKTKLCPSNEVYLNNGNLKSSLKRPSRSSKKKSLEKSVRFSPTEHVKNILHLNDIPQRTIENCWLNSDEFDAIVASHRSVLLCMEIGADNMLSEETETTRGLEHLTQNGARKRLIWRRKGWDSVMDEQVRQWMQGEEDWYKIQRLYQEANKESTVNAFRRAEQDEKSIQEYLANTRSEESTKTIELHDVDFGTFQIMKQVVNRSRDSYRQGQRPTSRNFFRNIASGDKIAAVYARHFEKIRSGYLPLM